MSEVARQRRQPTQQMGDSLGLSHRSNRCCLSKLQFSENCWSRRLVLFPVSGITSIAIVIVPSSKVAVPIILTSCKVTLGHHPCLTAGTVLAQDPIMFNNLHDKLWDVIVLIIRPSVLDWIRASVVTRVIKWSNGIHCAQFVRRMFGEANTDSVTRFIYAYQAMSVPGSVRPNDVGVGPCTVYVGVPALCGDRCVGR